MMTPKMLRNNLGSSASVAGSKNPSSHLNSFKTAISQRRHAIAKKRLVSSDQNNTQDQIITEPKSPTDGDV